MVSVFVEQWDWVTDSLPSNLATGEGGAAGNGLSGRD